MFLFLFPFLILADPIALEQSGTQFFWYRGYSVCAASFKVARGSKNPFINIRKTTPCSLRPTFCNVSPVVKVLSAS